MAIEEIRQIIRDYPNNRRNISMNYINFVRHGSTIDTGEHASFQIEVTNSGDLTMGNVKLHVNGIFDPASGEKFVKLTVDNILDTPVDFRNGITVAIGDIAAGSTVRSRKVWLTARHSTVSRAIIETHIADWETRLDQEMADATQDESGTRFEWRERIRED